MHNLNSVPLSALRAIEAIARTGTLARAAKELGITAGALSQRLAKAEAILGRPLFIRTSTGLKPSAICAQVAPKLTRAMTDLSAAVSDIRTVNKSILTVTVAPIFASRWLIWRIRKFNEDNPDISVRIEPTSGLVDLDRSEVDVGIRVGENLALGDGAFKLLDQRIFPVCSPEAARRIKTPADLLEMPVIRENDDLYGWSTWLSDRGISNPTLKPGPAYADASLCLDAVMTGQGIFMAWETLACDALDRGQIASPFAQRSLTGAQYWLVTSRASAGLPSVRKFKEWLRKELECSVRHWGA